jgi:anaerobic selenocysteine-containing dehydrogenase
MVTKKSKIFDVLPYDGDEKQRWDLHLQGARKHDYFRTQSEAIAAARRVAEASQPSKVLVHARDGHVYREFTFD